MIEVRLAGLGAVSPAGWGVEALVAAVQGRGEALLPATEVPRPPRGRPILVRPVPPLPTPRPSWALHPRLRRASAISQHTVAAALEAVGAETTERIRSGALRLGVILTVMTGSVTYSRRFYDEVLKDPPTASPLLFPETVFNAPASHLGAVMGSPAINYTLVGDPSTFLEGLAMGADWLVAGRVDGVVVVGAEEPDWLTAEAWDLFGRGVVLTGGAGAVFLTAAHEGAAAGVVRLQMVTEAQSYRDLAGRRTAMEKARRELESEAPFGTGGLLVDGRCGASRYDRAEREVWSDWAGPRHSPLEALGQGLAAGAAWQTVVAASAVVTGNVDRAVVSVAGLNQSAACAGLVRVD